jgi:hypothetical protein
MVQLSATRCICIAVLLVSIVSFVAITLCIASQRVFIVVRVYFVIDSVRNLLDTPSYCVAWSGVFRKCDQVRFEIDIKFELHLTDTDRN